MSEVQQATDEPDFEALFAEFAAKSDDEGDAPAAVTTEPAATEPAVAAAEEPAADETADDTTADDGDESTDDGEEAEEPAAEAKMTDDDLLSRLASMVKKAEPEPAKQTAPAEEPPAYSPEESEFLESYLNDWPDVAKAEALRRRAEYQQLLGYVFQEVAKEFRPIMETVKVLSERTHLSDLQTAVTDYGDVRDKVIAWVGTQPAYLQTAYKHVITSGTVDEVADLVDRYKREAGVTQRAAPVSKKATELPPATKQAAAELAPVSSKRSAVVQAADPSDFEAAFATFAEKL